MTGEDRAAGIAATHRRLATMIAAARSRSLPAHVDRDDVHGAAALGLVQAARSWRPDGGVPFDRWARIRIDGAITDHLRALDHVGYRQRARIKTGDAPDAPAPVTLDEALDKPSLGDVARDVAQRVDLHRAIGNLPARHRAVIVDTYLRDRQVTAVARDLGVHQTRISQIRAEALTLLRGALTA